MKSFIESLEDLLPCINCGVNADPADGFGTCTCGNEGKRQAILNLIEERVIGEDEKEFTKRSRPYEDSDTDKLWDLANGIEPISSGQVSTWGGSANTQFRKFALKLRNTIWREAELHKNELRSEQRAILRESQLNTSRSKE